MSCCRFCDSSSLAGGVVYTLIETYCHITGVALVARELGAKESSGDNEWGI